METIQRLEEEVKALKGGSQKSLASLREERASSSTSLEQQQQQHPRSPTKEEVRSISRAVEGRVSEVVKQEVPDDFVEYVPKGVHKGIQVNTIDETDREKEEKAAQPKMVTKGIQASWTSSLGTESFAAKILRASA